MASTDTNPAGSPTEAAATPLTAAFPSVLPITVVCAKRAGLDARGHAGGIHHALQFDLGNNDGHGSRSLECVSMLKTGHEVNGA